MKAQTNRLNPQPNEGAEETSPYIIELRQISHIYNEDSVFEKRAIDNVSLKIKAGEMVALIGHTGSGKSTLIQHLNALLKPSSGMVLINGKDIHTDKAKLKSIRQRVGLVFQYPEHQLFEAEVFKDVAFGPNQMGLTEEEVNTRVKSALEVVGLDESCYHKSPFELSGGQKRRAAIAGVLAMRPEILILDEPTAGLDPRGRDEILSQIKHMHTKLGLTIILVSHSMDDAARLTDRILVMNKGCIICDGTPIEVFAQGEMLKNIGLDVPQISSLMTCLHEKNSNLPTGIFSVEAAADAIMKLVRP
ncbi:MAG: energy-coupling factor transporter ATPase [Defluviitaleaceae bacterium]|nr:energy-coupling factor transporter ATPase [Defluviitaleaceae bacterium]